MPFTPRGGSTLVVLDGMQPDECSGDGENADTQPDVPLLLYVRLRTPGVPQSRNSGSLAHSLTKSARRNTQFGPIPHPDGTRALQQGCPYRRVFCATTIRVNLGGVLRALGWGTAKSRSP
jgi:hypothetical protein